MRLYQKSEIIAQFAAVSPAANSMPSEHSSTADAGFERFATANCELGRKRHLENWLARQNESARRFAVRPNIMSICISSTESDLASCELAGLEILRHASAKDGVNLPEACGDHKEGEDENQPRDGVQHHEATKF